MSDPSVRPDPQGRAADPRLNAFVTANAGSGKTTTLVSRVARLLLAKAAPQTILCVTFTKAAAAEMQARLFARLGGWSVMQDDALRQELAGLQGRDPGDFDAEQLSDARALFAKALETPGGLKVETIHAFCEKLLRRFPLEAGVSPGFEVLDDMLSARLSQAAREQVGLDAQKFPTVGAAYERFAVMLAIGDLEALFAAFENRREAIADWMEGRADPVGDIWRECGFEALADPVALAFEAMTPPALDPHLWRTAMGVLMAAKPAGDQARGAKMAQVAERCEAGEVSLDEALPIFFTAAGEPAKWITSSAALKAHPALQDALLAEQARLEEARERVRAALVAQITVDALILALSYGEAYAIEKKALGALDFTDLVAKAGKLLTSEGAAGWVLYKLDGGVDHILVDEAQDTAPGQWAILRALTGEFFAGAGLPRPASPLERTLFVVGDEKQSIFSFQGAAPERLLAEARHYGELITGAERPFEPIELLESFRSTPEVLGFVDAVFQPIDARRALRPRMAGQGEDIDLTIEHVARREGHPGVIDLWEPVQEDRAEKREAWEPVDAAEGRGAWRRLAERIAGEISAIVADGEAVFDKDARVWRPAGYGDVLILVRKRGPLFEELLRVLKQRGVPVAGADRLVLSEHPVFEDALALARFVCFPDDDLTLAGLLRSPLCDLSEDDLHDLAQPRRGRLWEALRARGDERTAWAEARALLDWAMTAGRALPPFDFYARLLMRLDGAGHTMRQRLLTRLGPEAEDALDEFLARTAAAGQSGLLDLQEFAQAFGTLTVSVKREMDQPRGEVRIMTAHGAKGLEAPIVFLPDTIGGRQGRGGMLLTTADGGFLWSPSKAGDCAATLRAKQARDQREADEALRLLYVGLTRARDRLIIGGRISATAKRDNIQGWYGAIEAAFDSVADDVRLIDRNGETVRRLGRDPERLVSPTLAPGAGPEALPAWTRGLARAEGPLARYASPSQLAETEKGPAPSPLTATDGLGRFRRGDIIHRLLQLLPDVAPAERREAADRILAREPDLTPTQAAEMVQAAFGVLEDARFAEVFGPGSRPEAAIAGGSPRLPEGLAISGRLDRLLVTADRVLVVDFKTNRPAPDRIEDADLAYRVQMAVYAAVLGEIFPGRRVEAALVWTDGPKLMPVPEKVMAEALASLPGAR